jgi:hypothetical protein
MFLQLKYPCLNIYTHITIIRLAYFMYNNLLRPNLIQHILILALTGIGLIEQKVHRKFKQYHYLHRSKQNSYFLSQF